MKVVFVGQADRGFATNRIGGSETCYRRLGTALRRAGCQVRFIVLGRRPGHGHFVGEGDTAFCGSAAQLNDMIATCRADIINVAPMTVRGQLWPSLRRQRRGGARVSSIYWMYPVLSGNPFVKARSAIFNRVAFDVVFGGSPRIVRHLRHWGIPAGLLRPPVDGEMFRHGPAGHQRGAIRTAGYIGRIGPDKGIDWFLRQDLTALKNDGIELRIYGYYDAADPGSLSLNLALQRHVGIRYQSCEISSVTAETNSVVPWLDQLDCLILPYTTLTGTVDIPLVCLEAIARGCAVATTDVGDIAAMLDEGVMMLAPGEGISDVLRRAQSSRVTALDEAFNSDSVADSFLRALLDKGSR